MIDPQVSQFLSFLVPAVVVTLAPGPDNLMVLSIGISRGRRQGVAFGLGAALGCLSHTALAALGVSALIAASPVAFTALRIAGGLYLAWLGIAALRSRGASFDAPFSDAPGGSLRGFFVKGLVANAINPKVILFFLAFLPQFVDRSAGGIPMQTVQLGLVFTAQAALLFGTLGWFAGRVGGWMKRSPRIGSWIDRCAGCVFIALGARLLVGL
jgi:threonine/homoserine/homoserine lactone efflux protein